MAIGERFRSSGAHGIARFLAEHQGCNAGFDVRRDEQLGSGKLSITCGRCGASVEYRAAEAGELAAGGPQTGPIPANGAANAPVEPPPPAPPIGPTALPPPSAPAPAPPAPSDAPPPVARPAGTAAFPTFRRSQPGRSGVLPSWVPVALIAALILGGLTMIAIGLTSDDEEQPATTPPAGQAPARQKPAQTPGGQNQQQQPAAAQKNKQQRQEQQTGGQSEAPIAPATGQGGSEALNRRTFAKRFAIGVPVGWGTGKKDGAIALTAPGSTAEILVFFQRGEAPASELARGARGFLRQRHQGAQVGAAKPVRIGSQRGLRVVATYRGGEEVAVVISAKGYAYVILRRVDRGASPDLGQQAEAALASFQPK